MFHRTVRQLRSGITVAFSRLMFYGELLLFSSLTYIPTSSSFNFYVFPTIRFFALYNRPRIFELRNKSTRSLFTPAAKIYRPGVTRVKIYTQSGESYKNVHTEIKFAGARIKFIAVERVSLVENPRISQPRE